MAKGKQKQESAKDQQVEQTERKNGFIDPRQFRQVKCERDDLERGNGVPLNGDV